MSRSRLLSFVGANNEDRKGSHAVWTKNTEEYSSCYALVADVIHFSLVFSLATKLQKSALKHTHTHTHWINRSPSLEPVPLFSFYLRLLALPQRQPVIL